MSPYRVPAPRDVVPRPRRPFLDTARRLHRASLRTGWRVGLLVGLAVMTIILAGCVLTTPLPTALRVALSLVLGYYAPDVARVVVGFVRAKRCRRLLGRATGAS